jgi:prepilin-type N-terminal cleavage/methylation domain-containing protein
MVTPEPRRAFTLVELMIVVSIIGILFAVGAPLLQQVNRFFILSKTRLEIQQEARSIMYVVTRNLRQAQSGTITISRADATQPFCSKISFTKEQGGLLVFQQKGTNLVQVIGGSQRVISKNLKYLAFTFPRSDDMTIISVSITLEKSIFEGRTKALHMASERVRIMN